MERRKENEGETEKGEANNLSVPSDVLRKDIVNLLDFIERLKNGRDQLALDKDGAEKLKLELTFMSACLQIWYFISGGFDAEMSNISYAVVHDLVQSFFHRSGDEMMVKIKDHVVPHLLENIKSFISLDHHSESSATMTEDQLDELLDALPVYLHYLPKYCVELIFPLMAQYEVLSSVCGNIRDFHVLKVIGCIEHEIVEYILPQFQLMAERVGQFCFILLAYQLYAIDEERSYQLHTIDEEEDPFNAILAHLLLKIIPTELEIMNICYTNLKASKSEEVGRFIKQLLEASPDILREYLIHLQEHMVTTITTTNSVRNIHVMIEFLLIILTDIPKDFIHHDKLFVLLARVGALISEVSIRVHNLEENTRNDENMNETGCVSLDLPESIELLKEDLKHVFLKVPANPSHLCFPKSDGPLFMTLLFRNLNDLLNSNAYSVALIKKEIGLVKEDLEFITSFFGNVEQKLKRNLWTRVLDVAYEAEHAINSILVRDHGLLQLIFLLPGIINKIKLIKEEVPQKISKNKDLIVANSPNKPVERKSSTKLIMHIIVGFEEETNLIIRQLTSGPAQLDVTSIIGMPGSGKTTLAFKVYSDKSITSHFDIRAWCTIDQEYDREKILQKIYNQVTGSDAKFSGNITVAEKLRKKLFGRRYLIVLDDLWDTAAWDELTMPFQDSQKGSRIILTSREKKVALHAKCQSNPLYLRLLTLDESWELLEKRVFEEDSCPDELKYVGKEIARKCNGLPLVLDLIIGVIERKEKKEDLWLEVLKNFNTSSFNNEGEIMEVIQLSYDRLPDHLKPCLLYLASYPKDKDIGIYELKNLWRAEGLVEQNEEVMEVYLDELISSSLVVVFNEKGGRKPVLHIHDLVHEFCFLKAEKEKLFHSPSSSSSSSSSSDVMPRGMTVHCDHSDENFVLFNPEKKNPYVKHLLSLKAYNNNLHYMYCHLKHLKLLKRFELFEIEPAYYLLNEIGMLVHLRCLKICTKAKALPLSFSNLSNLEILEVSNPKSNMVLSPSIWSLAKLQHVRISNCSFFDSHAVKPTVLEKDSKLENLRLLYRLKLSDSKDTCDIFKRFLNLRSLTFTIKASKDCSSEQICFPRLDVLNELEQVKAVFEGVKEWEHKHQCDLYFPLSLKKLKLTRFDLSSDSLSGIARLPNLQYLSIKEAIIQGGKEWNMEEVTFEKLKFLRLFQVSFSEWQVGEESFPVLEELQIEFCRELMEIPDSFGDIASLNSISLFGNRQLEASAQKIKEYVEEMTGEDKLDVNYY